MEIPPAELADLMALVKRHLGLSFGRHPEFEDLLGAGYMGMWKALVATEGRGICRRTTAATRGAMWSALNWLRSRENGRRRYDQQGQAVPRNLSLETLEEYLDNDHDSPVRLAARQAGLFTPEVAPGVLGQVEDEALRERVRAQLSDGEWELVRRLVMEGEKLKQLAGERKITIKQLRGQRDRALAKLRRARFELLTGCQRPGEEKGDG